MEGERSIQTFLTEDSELSSLNFNLDILNSSIKQLADAIGFKDAIHVGICICDSERMTHLHDEFMQDPTETDVMAFPSDEQGYLGDIIVCKDVAIKEAESLKHSTEAELYFYCLHGVLHLFGYDDQTPEEKNNMLTLQKNALLAEGIEIQI